VVVGGVVSGIGSFVLPILIPFYTTGVDTNTSIGPSLIKNFAVTSKWSIHCNKHGVSNCTAPYMQTFS